MPSSIYKPERDSEFHELFESGSASATYTDNPEALYTEYREIGHGNFGSVYYAIEKSTNEVVAVKKMSVVSTSSLKDSRQKYDDVIREIRTLRRLSHHPNLLAFRRAHCDPKLGLILLITEYCLGSCADVVETLREIEERDIAAIISQCLAGLVFVHSNGSIHRDVKASNILIGECGVVKLADFGSASNSTVANSFVGTPFWIAPEVILAMDTGQYDARADIWSLGITCHELVDGRPPYFSLNPMSALYQIAHNNPPLLPAHRRSKRSANLEAVSEETDTGTDNDREEFSEQFRDFVASCLQKEMNNRPSSSFLFENHPFVVRDLAAASATTQDLLGRTKRALSIADPMKHRRIRENFNAESSGTGSLDLQHSSTASGYEKLLAQHGARGGGPPSATDDSTAIAISGSRGEETGTESRDGDDFDLEDSDALASAVVSELDSLHLQLNLPNDTAAPTSTTDSVVDTDTGISISGTSQLTTVVRDRSSQVEPQGVVKSRGYTTEMDAKFATLKTKNMLLRQFEESQKYVPIREKFAALKRLRIAQQKDLRALEVRFDTDLRELRSRLSRAYEDGQREAVKSMAKLEERLKAENERRDREVSAAWKRAVAALQKLRKRALGANAGGLRLGAPKTINRSAIEIVTHAEARLKAIDRLKLMNAQRFVMLYAASLRDHRELALENEQKLAQSHHEEIEKLQLDRVESIYRMKRQVLARQFDLEQENHTAFFRSENEKLQRTFERRNKDLAKTHKIAEADLKRELDVAAKTCDKELRSERARIESDNSLTKQDREAAIRAAKERCELRRTELFKAIRRNINARVAEANRNCELSRVADQQALDDRSQSEMALLRRGQEVAKAYLETEAATELEREKQSAATNQVNIDKKCVDDRIALRARCDEDAAALRASQAAALVDFDNRARADLLAQHSSLLSAGTSQFSSTVNLHSGAASGSQHLAAGFQPSAERRLIERLYAQYFDALAPPDIDTASAADLHAYVLREINRFCTSDLTDPKNLLVAVANNRAQPPSSKMNRLVTAGNEAHFVKYDTTSSVDSTETNDESVTGMSSSSNGANLRPRGEAAQAKAADAKSKRSSMVLLNVSSPQNDNNNGVQRVVASSSSTALNKASSGGGAPVLKASLMQLPGAQTHYSHGPNASSPLNSGSSAGSAGRKSGAGLHQKSATNGSPSSSTGGSSSRQSAAQPPHRRLFGIFSGSSYNVNEPPAMMPNSDSVLASLNVPRSRASLNVTAPAAFNSNLSRLPNATSDNTQM